MADTDRIEAVARALYGSWSVDHQPVSQAMARDAARRDATTAVAALDAYDREQREQSLRFALDTEARREADLRERIAADIEADVLLSPFSGGREVNAYNHGARNAASHAARIARGGQS